MMNFKYSQANTVITMQSLGLSPRKQEAVAVCTIGCTRVNSQEVSVQCSHPCLSLSVCPFKAMNDEFQVLSYA